MSVVLMGGHNSVCRDSLAVLPASKIHFVINEIYDSVPVLSESCSELE